MYTILNVMKIGQILKGKGLYPPNFSKKCIFDFLMFFGKLKYGESS